MRRGRVSRGIYDLLSLEIEDIALRAMKRIYEESVVKKKMGIDDPRMIKKIVKRDVNNGNLREKVMEMERICMENDEYNMLLNRSSEIDESKLSIVSKYIRRYILR